jgi:hypothetical protein
MSWAALARDVGVAASTIKRYSRATDAEADGVLALLRWLGVPPEDFVAKSSVRAELLRPFSDGMIRVDMCLVAELPSWSFRGGLGSRTSIQTLIRASQAAGRTVASLTRWSPA